MFDDYSKGWLREMCLLADWSDGQFEEVFAFLGTHRAAWDAIQNKEWELTTVAQLQSFHGWLNPIYTKLQTAIESLTEEERRDAVRMRGSGYEILAKLGWGRYPFVESYCIRSIENQ